ncbi:hypothetical protein [Metabacillus fastidiosus]|uniref:hypothetical protein n=1 Tax=Metabacillus fastidiosus TaxID=1458 RepID=UPI002E209B6F|nr:hypothetical protein [Metabacillus fastidiosus]
MKNKILIMALFTILLVSSLLPNAAAASTSFLMNTKKNYTYTVYEQKNKHNRSSMTATFTGKINDSDLWFYRFAGDFFQQLYLQDDYGLESASNTELKFPLVKGAEWKKGNATARIISLNNTVKTPAGTFSNCVLVETVYNAANKDLAYYAPGHGLIKLQSGSGATVEVSKIENAHYGRVLIKEKGIAMYNPQGKVHRILTKGEGLKVFKENVSSYDVGGGYYVKKSKATLFYTGFVYSKKQQLDIYAPNGKLHRKTRVGETIRVYGFKNGDYQVGGGYYISADNHVQYDR